MYIATHPRLTLRSSSCISTGGNIDPYIRVFVSALSAHSNHIYIYRRPHYPLQPNGPFVYIFCATADFMRLLLAYNHLFLQEQIAISSISGRFRRTITFSFPDSQQQLGSFFNGVFQSLYIRRRTKPAHCKPHTMLQYMLRHCTYRQLIIVLSM